MFTVQFINDEGYVMPNKDNDQGVGKKPDRSNELGIATAWKCAIKGGYTLRHSESSGRQSVPKNSTNYPDAELRHK